MSYVQSRVVEPRSPDVYHPRRHRRFNLVHRRGRPDAGADGWSYRRQPAVPGARYRDDFRQPVSGGIVDRRHDPGRDRRRHEDRTAVRRQR